MSETTQAIQTALDATHAATMAPDVVRTSGAGKAYQSVAQSTAIAVQDAADYLRNVSTMSTTAMGVAMAQLLATGDPQYAQAIDTANKMMTDATANFSAIGKAAGEILNKFPSS